MKGGTVLLALLVALYLASCGSGSESPKEGAVAGRGSEDDPRGSANRAGVGGRFDTTLDLGNESGAGGGSITCAGQVTRAEPVPLDLFLMLDTSASMLESTAAGLSKWEAVRGALGSFFSDRGSAGLGISLQYFPLPKPGVPDFCTTDAECGPGGPCFTRVCRGSPDILPCVTDDDCGAGFESLGPCIPFGECTNDRDFLCQLDAGVPCGVEPRGLRDLGECVAPRPSFCMGRATCEVREYAVPAVPVVVLPDARARLAASIGAQFPIGDTPTAPALQGALTHARSWARSHPERAVAIVLATDGLPTQCVGPEVTAVEEAVAEVSALAGEGWQGTPSIPSFVIGVFGPEDPLATVSNLNSIARAGNTERAFIVNTADDAAQQFLQALNAIRGARLNCELRIPEAEVGQTLDYSQVNVEFLDAGSRTKLFYVPTVDDCDPVLGGWTYDTDPKESTPTRILVCPESCSQSSGSENASIQIEIGCATIVR